ncbi:MAG: GntR family transcriptional regulator [Verrucomicrobiota bacterium]|nr:GntR family transcriptional regulator [Verrucomicrobiota bacterium]
MKTLVAQSKTDQVLDYLRVEISSQNLKPGDKLLSIRKLAGNFSTSEQVIKSAYDIMEKEGLIFRLPRKGVFVKKIPDFSHIKEIYILGISLKKKNKYFEEILNILNPPFLKSDLSYTTRTYSPEIAIEKVLNIEVDKINDMSEVDCVLINAVSLERKDVLKCLQINKPLIFLGDFRSREIQDLEYNQVTGDNAYIAGQQVQYLDDNKCDSITLFSGSLKHFFYNEFYEGVVEKTKELGLRFNIVEFPKGISSKSDSLQQLKCEELLENFLQKNKICQGGIIWGIDRKLILDTLLNNKKVNFQKILFAPPIEIDYSQLCKVILNRIDELLLDPSDTKKIKTKLPITLG